MEEEIYYKCNACLHFCHNEDMGIFYCEKGNIYLSKNQSPVCIDCECYTCKENHIINANVIYHADNKAVAIFNDSNVDMKLNNEKKGGKT